MASPRACTPSKTRALASHNDFPGRRYAMRNSSQRSLKEAVGFLIFIGLVTSLVWLTHSSASPSPGEATTESPSLTQNPQRGPKNKPTPRCPHCAPAGSQEIYISLIDLPVVQGGEVVLNSR